MKCKLCGQKTNRPKFCCNRHKDRYHNEHNPRGIFAHLKRDTDFDKPIWAMEDDHSFEEEEMGIHE